LATLIPHDPSDSPAPSSRSSSMIMGSLLLF
jgi:hypothetical protein